MEMGRNREFKITSGRSLSKGRSDREAINSIDFDKTAKEAFKRQFKTPNKSSSSALLPKVIDFGKSGNKLYPNVADLAKMDKYLEKNFIEATKYSQKGSKSIGGDEPDRQSVASIVIKTPVIKNKQLVKGQSIILEPPKPRAYRLAYLAPLGGLTLRFLLTIKVTRRDIICLPI